MKNCTFILMSLFVSVSLFGQYNKIDTSFFSDALQENKLVDVYFPPGYDENPDLYYPVIYYLHGWGGDQNTMGSEMMSVTQSMIQNGTIEPVIMVGADNSPDPLNGSMYVNSILWGNYEEYMVNDLINWIESSFRVVPDNKNYRALLGHSMGGYGSFRYGILHKEKFRVLAASASAVLNFTEDYLEESRQVILQQNQPGPPFFYDFSNGFMTGGLFLFAGAFSPNYNTPQTYIDPPIVEFPLDENGSWIDSILNKTRNNSISHLIHQLSPDDSVGILFGCGSADELGIYPPHIAFQDSLEMLGLPYEFFDHNGTHIMPASFKQRTLIFIDSLLMSPTVFSSIHIHKNHVDITIYPNPVNDYAIFNFNSVINEPVEISIYNAAGIRLTKKKYPTHQKEIILNMSDFTAGIYLCRILVGNEIITKKIIKQ